ncbi:MAG TPA: hypothetical protein VNO70_06745 [Blastocatellia bacterium]|nr:hypothetical protein [Blastocatellia bacterium]
MAPSRTDASGVLEVLELNLCESSERLFISVEVRRCGDKAVMTGPPQYHYLYKALPLGEGNLAPAYA